MANVRRVAKKTDTLGCMQIYRVCLHRDALWRMCKALHDALWSMLEGLLKLSVFAAFSEA